MKNIFLAGILMLLSACVAEYPSSNYYGEREHGWHHDYDEHHWRHDDDEEHHRDY